MLPRVIFHHVNKCAGTTLLKFLEGTTAHERAAHVETLVAGQGGGATRRDAFAAILRAEFLHDPYGIADWKAVLGNAIDVIFLRDPVARLHSEWRMITRWDDALVAACGDRHRRLRAVAREGFGAFLALPGATVFGNAIAHHLAFGEPVLAELRAACGDPGDPHAGLVDRLDARLAAIDVVGFVEEFDESFTELVARLGCFPPLSTLQVHNVHGGGGTLEREEQRLAEACTAIDRRLVAGGAGGGGARRAARPPPLGATGTGGPSTRRPAIPIWHGSSSPRRRCSSTWGTASSAPAGTPAK